jgi:hypothetical protein
MKRFFTFSFILLSIALFGQNLIPDGSAENVAECPSSLGNIDIYTSWWQSFRGSPDYWHSCSENPLLGWNNSLGFQEPRTGEGYLGLITFHQGLTNGRESFGIQLENPLQIGVTYHLSFYVSAAYRPSSFNMTSNNIGALLMVDDYLDSDEQGTLPNYSNFSLQEIVTDTTNWVNVLHSFVADSAYRFICFGNFFDDGLTDTLRLEGENFNAIAYYYFDDFCLSTDANTCDIVMSSSVHNSKSSLNIYPNPATSTLFINTPYVINGIEIFSMTGERQTGYEINNENMKELRLDLPSGLYILQVFADKEVMKKRFVVQ